MWSSVWGNRQQLEELNPPFPYSFGWQESPTDEGEYACWQLHGHFYPPLFAFRDGEEFIVGNELLCEAQRDLQA